MDPNSVLETAAANGPWAAAACFLGWIIVQAFKDERKRVDALIAGNQTNNQAIALALQDLKDTQHRIVTTLEKICGTMGDMDHRVANLEREVMLEVKRK